MEKEQPLPQFETPKESSSDGNLPVGSGLTRMEVKSLSPEDTDRLIELIRINYPDVYNKFMSSSMFASETLYWMLKDNPEMINRFIVRPQGDQ